MSINLVAPDFGARPAGLGYLEVTQRIFARCIDGGLPIDPFRDLDEPCLIWTGGCLPNGYPSISVADKTELPHRIVCEAFNGVIPAGYQVDHVCRVRRCLRPSHLEAVTPAENMARTQKPECANGHPYDKANTLWLKNRTTGERTQRACRTCNREKMRRHRARKASR
jgi:hypothetical protein